MIRSILALLGLFLLAACATTGAPEPRIVIKEVLVPVATSCVPKGLPGEPAYVDTDDALKKAAGPEDRLQLVAAGRKQRIARSREIEPVIRACRDP